MNLLLNTDLLFFRLGGIEAHKSGNLCAVRGVPMDTELDALRELLRDLLVANLLPHFNDLVHLGLLLGGRR